MVSFNSYSERSHFPPIFSNENPFENRSFCELSYNYLSSIGSYLIRTINQFFDTYLGLRTPPLFIPTPLSHFFDKHSLKPNLDAFKDLYPSLVATWDDLPERDKDKLYRDLRRTFRHIEFDNNPREWVQKADLLDAIDFLHRQDPKRFPLLQKKENLSSQRSHKRKIHLQDVPLIRIAKIKDVAEKKIEGDSPKKVLNKLGEIGEVESSKTAKSIHFLTSQKVLRAAHLDWIYRTFTTTSGAVYKRKTTTQNLAKQSIGLSIKPFEILRYEKADSSSRTTYCYRGPRFLFDRSVHSYEEKGESFNDWFIRDLTPEARAAHLAWQERKSEKLVNKYGLDPLEKAKAFIISTASCDIRIKVLKRESLHEQQTIVGKALTDIAARLAVAAGENISYLSTQFKSLFSILEVFGLQKDEDITSFPLLDSGKIQDFTPPVTGTSEERLFTIRQHEGIIQSGIKAFMRGTYNFLNSKGVVQVVQRLAPRDIHNYVNTLPGRALDPLEAVKKLGSLLHVSEEYREASSESLLLKRAELPNDDPDRKLLDKWIPLKQAAEVFEKWKTSLNGDLPATIEFYGGNASVSTQAVSNRPEILARNDHKLMFFEHSDGTVSVHSFIGATGVNDVGVSQTLEPGDKGRSIGFMGFGKNIRKGFAGQAQDHETTHGIRKGTTVYKENITGSTVISWYVGDDYIPRGDFLNVKSNVTLKNPLGFEQEVEVQVPMGAPLLIETKLAIAECLFRRFDLTLYSPEEINLSLLKTWAETELLLDEGSPKKNRLLPQDQMALEKLEKLLEAPDQNKESLNTLIGYIQTRLSSINTC